MRWWRFREVHAVVSFQPRIDETGTPMDVATLSFKASDWLAVAGVLAEITNIELTLIVSA